MLQQLWESMVLAEQDVRKGFVVAIGDVVAGLQPLDQIGFQQKRFDFGRCGDEQHLRRLAEIAIRGEESFQRRQQLAARLLVVVNQLAQRFILERPKLGRALELRQQPVRTEIGEGDGLPRAEEPLTGS